MINLHVLNLVSLALVVNLQAAYFNARFGNQWNSSIDNMDLWDDVQFNDLVFDLSALGPVLCRVHFMNPRVPLQVLRALL